jgi:hypothetical protein
MPFGRSVTCDAREGAAPDRPVVGEAADEKSALRVARSFVQPAAGIVDEPCQRCRSRERSFETADVVLACDDPSRALGPRADNRTYGRADIDCAWRPSFELGAEEAPRQHVDPENLVGSIVPAWTLAVTAITPAEADPAATAAGAQEAARLLPRRVGRASCGSWT